MVRTQIQLTEAQAEALHKSTARKKISMAEAVRQGVDLFIETEKMPDREELKKRFLQLQEA